MPAEGFHGGWIDSHVHLQACDADAADGSAGIAIQLVNATGPADWLAVARLAHHGSTRRYKAFGVHPWKVADCEEGWLDQLRAYLEADDVVSVGEIGVDQWIEPRDERLQQEVFVAQLELANTMQLPPTLHCLRAWQPLLEGLRSCPPKQGFLLHAFAGSLELQRQLLDLGGHFSFSAYAADPHRKRMREAVAYCPLDRLLVETDAPDMTEAPAAIADGYRWIADHRSCELATLSDAVQRTFTSLFDQF
jgi:TatD DNase family protein